MYYSMLYIVLYVYRLVYTIYECKQQVSAKDTIVGLCVWSTTHKRAVVLAGALTHKSRLLSNAQFYLIL